MQNRLLVEHQKVLLGADRLELLLDEIETVPLATLIDARWSFARQTLTHLDNQDAQAYPLLLADPDVRTSEAARGLAGEREAVAAGFQDHAQRYWTDAAIDADRQGYAASLRPNLAALRTLFAREEVLLYPLLRGRTLPDEPVPGAGRWIAQAWKYRSTGPAPR